jgi:hypothetical protein
MEEPPGEYSGWTQYSWAKKRREHRKRRLRAILDEKQPVGVPPCLLGHDPQSSSAALSASFSPFAAPLRFPVHVPYSASEDHLQYLCRLESRHSLQLSVQEAKAKQDAARAQTVQEHLFFSSVHASARDRQTLADQHRQHLLRAEADHLQELAVQSVRAAQDAARAQAAEDQLLRGKETAATLASTVTAVTESAREARAEAADLRALLSARDEELAALKFSAAESDRRCGRASRARVTSFLANPANDLQAPPPTPSRAPSPPAPRPTAVGPAPRP